MQAKALLRAVGKRHNAFQLQTDFARALFDHLPGLLPGAAVDRQRVVGAVGWQGKPAVRAAEAALADAVGPGCQRVTGQAAWATGIQGDRKRTRLNSSHSSIS